MRVIAREGKEVLQDTMCRLESFNPVRPVNPLGMVMLATDAVCVHSGIRDTAELFRRGKIDKINPDSDTGGIAITQDARGDIVRSLFLEFDVSRPIYSVIVAVHELRHSLQPEHEELFSIFRQRTGMRGYASLVDAIHADARLREMRIRFGMRTHELDFFALPEVLKLAERVGMDVESLKSYLTYAAPLADFFMCWVEGESYVLQGGISAKAPQITQFPAVQDLYRLIGFLDAISSLFSSIKSVHYEVGIGIYEYFRIHPNKKLPKSEDFRRAVSEHVHSLAPISAPINA